MGGRFWKDVPVLREPDPIFSDAKLAVLYDLFEGERDDLDAYVAMVGELRATSVLDIGCGTGEFLLRLAALGVEAIGIDPAGASIDIAKQKPGADQIRWITGDVTALPAVEVDLVTMTANVAQVFVDDEAWSSVLDAAASGLRPGGHVVFETRDPAKRAWEGWNPERSFQSAIGPDASIVETWNDVTAVELPLVTFNSTFRFADGSTAVSMSTLRFRSRDEIEASLDDAGFDVVDLRDAPDRPGRELVFVARRRSQPWSAGRQPRSGAGITTAT